MTRRRARPHYDNSIIGPRYDSASFYYTDQADIRENLHKRGSPRGRYGRYHNQSWELVERRLTSLCHGDDSLVFASGMAAHFTTFVSIVAAGDHVLFPAESYRVTRRIFLDVLPRFGVHVHEYSVRDPQDLERVMSRGIPAIKLAHIESPSSPHMYVTDIEQVRRLLGASTVITVDSSFAPPPNFHALDHGADIALMSATKYLNGHGDLMGGVATGRRDLMDRVREYRDLTGPIMDGHAAALLDRSLDSLQLRLERANRSALLVADFLEKQPAIQRVYYTGLASHPHHELATKYFRGHGGVVTFDLDLDRDRTASFVDSLDVPFIASNFGAPQTLVEQSVMLTYYAYSDSELARVGVKPGTVRLAIGFADDPEVIVADLAKALQRL